MGGIALHRSGTRVHATRNDLVRDRVVRRAINIDLRRKRVTVTDDGPALGRALDRLAFNAAEFGEGRSAAPDVMTLSRWAIYEVGRHIGVMPASIAPLYNAMGRGEIGREMTVPMHNIRMNAYGSFTALFAAAVAGKVGAFGAEIARSEIGYTGQRPAEYGAMAIAAAVKAGYRGPLFLQGDHFQLAEKIMNKGGEVAEAERRVVEALIVESLEAGFGSVDIDTSTVEKRNKRELSVDEQLKPNYVEAARMLVHLRQAEKSLGLPWSVSVGTETGEIGSRNTSVGEYRVFMAGLARELAGYQRKYDWEIVGTNKISVATGTSHGGVVLADGTRAKVKIGFNTLRDIGEAARADNVITAQHGASTLPDAAFSRFVEVGVGEVHLATGFQMVTRDHMPHSLYGPMVAWLGHECAGAQKNMGKAAASAEEMTWAQAVEKDIKRASGPFKADIWRMPARARRGAFNALQAKFAFLFDQLGVTNTAEMVRGLVPMPEVRMPFPEEGKALSLAVRDEAARDLDD